jgi:hypothetical protein
MLFFQEPNSDKVDKIVQTMLDLTLRHNVSYYILIYVLEIDWEGALNQEAK